MVRSSEQSRNELDDKLKQISIYSSCTLCNCIGWKRRNDDTTISTNDTWINRVTLQSNCNGCSHTMGLYLYQLE